MVLKPRIASRLGLALAVSLLPYAFNIVSPIPVAAGSPAAEPLARCT